MNFIWYAAVFTCCSINARYSLCSSAGVGGDSTDCFTICTFTSCCKYHALHHSDHLFQSRLRQCETVINRPDEQSTSGAQPAAGLCPTRQVKQQQTLRGSEHKHLWINQHYFYTYIYSILLLIFLVMVLGEPLRNSRSPVSLWQLPCGSFLCGSCSLKPSEWWAGYWTASGSDVGGQQSSSSSPSFLSVTMKPCSICPHSRGSLCSTPYTNYTTETHLEQ